MSGPDRGSWRWKVQDPGVNPGLGLLYEPGNWGDVLKGAWAIVTVATVISNRESGVFRYLDPFAGRPTYPLVEAARERLAAVPALELKLAQQPYTAQGRIASTALLVRDAAILLGVDPLLCVFDLDPARAVAWSEIHEARPLDSPSGEDILRLWRDCRPIDFILVDPYDLFDRPGPLVPGGLEAAVEAPVLFYLFNKAPRGGGHERAYRSFRKLLGESLPREVELLTGRIPADALLPRAYHEVILAGPRDLVREARPRLEVVTQALARHLGEQGAFEAGLTAR